MTPNQTTLADIGKDAPIVGLAGAAFLGLPLNDWVLITGLVYGVAKLCLLGVEAYWKWKDRRSGKGE